MFTILSPILEHELLIGVDRLLRILAHHLLELLGIWHVVLLVECLWDLHLLVEGIVVLISLTLEITLVTLIVLFILMILVVVTILLWNTDGTPKLIHESQHYLPVL